MVIDASVWVSALVAQDAHHATSRRLLKRRSDRGQPVVVPTLALAEVAGAVSRRTGAIDLGQQSAEAILRVPGLRLVSLDTELGREAARIAAQEQLRGADAVYVATAHRFNLPLLTWDDELQAKARRLVRVVRP